MIGEVPLIERDRSALELVGTYCEVHWTGTNRLAKRQCEKCVYVVRGHSGPMVCVELVYDAIDGVHRRDATYWVPMDAIQYMRVLTVHEAQARIDRLEREVFEDSPRG